MRNYIILTIVGISGSILAYHFIDDLTGPEQHRVVIAEAQTDSSSGANIQDKLDNLANAFQHFQQTYQQQLKHTQSEQARLNNMLSEMDHKHEPDKHEPLETTAPEPVDDYPLSRDDTEPVLSSEVVEQNFGNWMNDTLLNESWDIENTAQITEQASKTLTELPGVSLDDMQCGERFCRATLSHQSGELPDTSKLMGKPPFTNDAFTVNEEDGRVTLYFTGPGVTLGDLQNEALQANQYN
jgi:hypothetical protein